MIVGDIIICVQYLIPFYVFFHCDVVMSNFFSAVVVLVCFCLVMHVEQWMSHQFAQCHSNANIKINEANGKLEKNSIWSSRVAMEIDMLNGYSSEPHRVKSLEFKWSKMIAIV